MPIRHGGIAASRASTWLRDHFWRSTIALRRSRPTTWNEFLPISMPIVATVAIDLLDMAMLRLTIAPSQHHSPVGQEHGRTIPLAVVHPHPRPPIVVGRSRAKGSPRSIEGDWKTAAADQTRRGHRENGAQDPSLPSVHLQFLTAYVRYRSMRTLVE